MNWIRKTVHLISDDELSITLQTRKTLEDLIALIQKADDKDVDVPRSCFDSSQICDFVGTYL